MLKSKIYREHFPVKSHITSFNQKEKRILCRWSTVFNTEVLMREYEKSRKCYQHYCSYHMDKYDKETMIGMIEKNSFDDRYLLFLNAIIYRHKYNAFLSTWTFPILTEKQCEKYFGNIVN